MNRQEIFDKVFTGLRSQGFERSFNKRSQRCKYRGDNGMKCAVGHLIPDELYKERWDKGGTVYYGLPSHLWKKLDIDFSEDGSFIGKMQEIHDYNGFPDIMEKALRNLAIWNNLTVPE